MKTFFLKRTISVLFCAVLSAVFIVTLYFCAPKIESVPETSGELTEILYSDGVAKENVYTIGTDFTAVRINDLGKLGQVTEVNYVADEFVSPGHLDYDFEIVDLSKPFDFAEKGSLVFVIANLDPRSENFDEQSESLSEYKMGDYWHFTLSLPKIFAASNVYQKASLVARHGEIENYDFAEYNTNYNKKTEKFAPLTDTTYLDLQFYTRREALSNTYASAQIVTVHYQSTGSAYSGITDCPLIGKNDEIKNVNELSKNLLITFAVLAAVVLAILIVLSLLKHTATLIPAIVWISGIAILLFSRYFLTLTTGAPLLWVAFWLASSFVIIGGALSAIGRSFGKIPTKIIFPAFATVGGLLAFICPFIPFGAASVISTLCSVIKGVCVASLFGFIVLATLRKENKNSILQIDSVTIIAVAVCSSLFMPQVFPSQINPLFWMCVAAVITTFIGVFVILKETEKENEYLAANLHLEVERQVKDIKAVIAERDNLLQFVSHDMKKPLSSAVMLCDTALDREKDEEQIKTISIIKQDAERVISNLTEIAAYAKLNYLSETSQVVDMSELCALLFKYHEFDCDANGIVLKNTAKAHIKAFVKPKGIENVVSNIIINAIEHANCSTITLSVKARKNKVVLCVADDGKGIDEGLDVFKPYVSENDTETGGVGLYLCKNIIESMNGELTFDSSDCGTVFYISLLKA